MALTPVLSSAVNGLHKSAARAGDAALQIVQAGTNSTPPSQSVKTSTSNLSGNTAIDAQLIGANEPQLLEGMVSLIEAKAAYSANAQAVRSAEELATVANDILA